MRTTILVVVISFCSCTNTRLEAQLLEVKSGRTAIVKLQPTSDATEITRLAAGTRILKVGEAPLYYSIRLADNTVGWSYKGNFNVLTNVTVPRAQPPATKQLLMARSDVLKIIVVDVEVGDATVIICPVENGKQDVILIDTGVNDSERIKKELIDNGFTVSGKPITRFIATHYDSDHIGHAHKVIPLSKIVYDHGPNNIDSDYLDAVNKPGVDRRLMTLSYQETFTGGVTVKCVAVNGATDFDPAPVPSTADNDNSIALVISFHDFDYFTAGDLTLKPEASLAKGIQNCDVYHVNHHGSRVTSSSLGFLQKLDPEVSVVSNGTMHGHPTAVVGQRLTQEIHSKLFQTNFNPDDRAFKPDFKFIADDTFHEESEAEDAEGAAGTIRIVIDPLTEKYYVIMPDLALDETTFNIEK
jgi:beta-lactamase superfamily II metal-dependent hydrolase